MGTVNVVDGAWVEGYDQYAVEVSEPINAWQEMTF